MGDRRQRTWLATGVSVAQIIRVSLRPLFPMLFRPANVRRPPRHPFARLVGIAALVIGASYLWNWYGPTSPQIEGAEAFWCNVWYSNHPTHADTMKIEHGYWVVDASWRRTPTCGELLRAGKLQRASAYRPPPGGVNPVVVKAPKTVR